MLIHGMMISLLGFLVVCGVLLLLLLSISILAKFKTKEPKTEDNEVMQMDYQDELIAVITATMIRELGHNHFTVNRIYCKDYETLDLWSLFKWSHCSHGGR